jgi:hypothetical protein
MGWGTQNRTFGDLSNAIGRLPGKHFSPAGGFSRA